MNENNHGTVTEKMVRVKTVWPDQCWMKKIVRLDHFWSTKNGPAGPFVVTKSGPGWLKMVRCQEFSNNIST